MKQESRKTPWMRTAVIAAGLCLGAVALAASPTVSVPSTPDIDGKVNIRGKDLAALTNVTVRFTHEKLSPIDVIAQVSSNGSFVVQFAPPIVGGYAVTVYDSNGQLVGKGNFGYIR